MLIIARSNFRVGAHAKAQGFSLIELMIGLVAGLIVIGAVLAFTVATVRASTENTRSARLTQDLRTGMNLIVRELRRAGYDSASVSRLAQGVPLSAFTGITISGECIAFAYDRPAVGAIGSTPAAAELRGVRRNGGALQMNTTSSPIACGGTNGWFDVSDPGVVTLTAFTPTLVTLPFCSVMRSTTNTAVPPVTTTVIGQGQVRNIALTLTGALASDAALVRSVTNDVRVRADPLTFTTTLTTAPDLPPTCP